MRRLSWLLALVVIWASFVAQPGHAQAPPAYRPPGGIALGSGTKTATATAGAATLSQMSGVVTSEAITTAAGASYTLTLTNTTIAANDVVLASVANGTNSAGSPSIARIQPAAGSVVILVQNLHASAAFNGTIKISFAVLKN